MSNAFLIGLGYSILFMLLVGVPAMDWWVRVLNGKFKPWKDWKNDHERSKL